MARKQSMSSATSRDDLAVVCGLGRKRGLPVNGWSEEMAKGNT